MGEKKKRLLWPLIYLVCLISCCRKTCLQRKPKGHDLFSVPVRFPFNKYTSYRVDCRDSVPSRGQGIFSSPPLLDCRWGPPASGGNAEMVGWLVNDNLKGFGKERSWPILRYPQAICLEGLRKPRTIPTRRAGLRVEIWTRDTLNTKQECHPLDGFVLVAPNFTTWPVPIQNEFRNNISLRQSVGLHGRGIGPSHGLFLRMTAQNNGFFLCKDVGCCWWQLDCRHLYGCASMPIARFEPVITLFRRPL
jgi:hypothetical protein